MQNLRKTLGNKKEPLSTMIYIQIMVKSQSNVSCDSKPDCSLAFYLKHNGLFM